ncbi:hypothetical protein GUJ93_ZPchr0010g9705 [Zizania palustris]|uniref:F-box associated domain-containing protein n=1 Tax=Zizania palustris TaxID=103762 RepID=A0A8J5WC65_ZIZPA|nr:hypothetical protein GUJ93_ZPchr0010g9705 [Zizania palustris]
MLQVLQGGFFLNLQNHGVEHFGFNNPVMFCGEFYCLGRKGNLGVFDPTSDTWRILDKPEPIHAEMDLLQDDHRGREFCYLVDMEGELVSVFLHQAEVATQIEATRCGSRQLQRISGVASPCVCRLCEAIWRPRDAIVTEADATLTYGESSALASADDCPNA